ncbi:carboxymuconolactone decarboxylase family protein [Lentibacter sp. XHP0401]|jgi:AhpD family alkylhydroperoxidase|uniref:carboxymuconolactone decarboxylase family protein n=1 Tax=Lentibacter sp. XHP0401 TaxID=2984334 RepID=UPI0021E7EDBE|nr:carboxymuconolactone decarboxylase family protein [Lentibacter sp. XHP0401]MCV2891898.1 carboxymuconolactone decarboxylase family protein [Lentibacter sp. XHP0401]
MKNYTVIADRYRAGYGDLAQVLPSTTSAFGRLVMDATGDGDLSIKVKELIAFAIAINLRCDDCLAHHAHAVFRAGASRREVAEMIGVAILMGGGPSTVYGVEALRAYDAFAEDALAR